jgi:AhpD family alkylhydroperoxidase
MPRFVEAAGRRFARQCRAPRDCLTEGSEGMVEDWLALIGNMNGAVGDLRRAAPEVMKTFSDMARAAHGGAALDDKTKELVALGISVAVRCAPCIAYHAQGALKHGASREAIAETLAMAIYMGAGPSVMYAAEALEAVDQLMAKAPKPE